MPRNINTLSIHKAHLFGEGLWDDLRFPASGINPPGVISDPARNSATGLLDFSGTADNRIAGAAQLPHEWLQGSVISPHLHLLFPTSDAGKNSRWKLEYTLGNREGNFEAAYETYAHSETITVPNPANVLYHAEAPWSDIVMAGYRHSCMVLWRITRLANSDVLDDDTSAITLLEFDIHYQKDRMGSFSRDGDD